MKDQLSFHCGFFIKGSESPVDVSAAVGTTYNKVWFYSHDEQKHKTAYVVTSQRCKHEQY